MQCRREPRGLMPRYKSRLRYVDHLAERGHDLYALPCAHDVEGLIANWARGNYHSDGATTSWLKIKNPDFSQMAGCHELFEGRGGSSRATHLQYRLDPAARTIA